MVTNLTKQKETPGSLLCFNITALERVGIGLLLFSMIVMSSQVFLATEAIKLHPQNPHYFLFRGKPTVLITSGEHYGAVLNLDFDYSAYLDELQSKGLNLTRIWPGGPYLEIPGTFNISNNTLAPAPGRFSCIWARSATPGYAGGGNKFDLNSWNEAHLARLRDFVVQAGKRGVVVEISLFCPFYEDRLWDASPLKAVNNVNGIGGLSRTEVYTLKDSAILAVQDAMVRKVVTELKGLDNVYYEICNEPYYGGVTVEWQDHIADTIVKAEKAFPLKHLLARNIANGSTKVESPHPAISILNFHYSRPPESVPMNFYLNKVIGFNETGFDGPADSAYRIQGWDFILAGGALFNHLDYSFTAHHPRGTFELPASTPGGGSPALRSQLRILKEFMDGFDFIKMKPDVSVLKGGVPDGVTARALAEKGQAYAIYVHHGKPGYLHTMDGGGKPRPPYVVPSDPQRTSLILDLPAGAYKAEWVNTKTGKVDKAESLNIASGESTLVSPSYHEDIALRIKRK
jgi:hypothetical protein